MHNHAWERQRSRFRRRGLWILLVAGLGVGLGLGLWWSGFQTSSPAHAPMVEPAPPPAPVRTPATVASPDMRFTDVTTAAGIDFTHHAGARGDTWYPETIGSGVGFVDYDGDGWPDILLINGTFWPPHQDMAAAQTPPTMRLYRNTRDGTFEDVTQAAGLALPLYGMGLAAADYDNDGDTDLVITGYQRNLFMINNGDGSFSEATQRVGLLAGKWGSGAAFFDYDRDGWLDLVISNYIAWMPELEHGLDCTYGTPAKDYCPVRYFAGQGLTLYHNRGDGTFEEVTQRAGVAAPGSRAFAPLILDSNDDGWPDILLASDGTPTLLLRNQGDGTFVDVGRQAGLALDAGGVAYAGMGIDAAYPYNDGRLCIAIGNFVGEPTTLHCRVFQPGASQPELYADVSTAVGIGRATLRHVTFGLFFFDADLDGWTDLFMVNGHVVDETRLRNVPRAQPPQLFRNLGNGSFGEIVPPAGSGLEQRLVGRGAAYADYDGDGDLDILLSQNQGPALLLRNDTPRQGHYLRLQLRGTRSNRDAIGATVRLQAGAQVQRQTLSTGRSYYSQNDMPLTFGLGEARQAARVEIVWPSGSVDVYHDVPGDTTLQAIEGAAPAAPESPSQPPVTAPAPVAESPATLPEATSSAAYLAHVDTGVAAYQAENYVAATLAFEAARALQPSALLPYSYLAELYWRQNKAEQAADIVRALAGVTPDAYLLDRLGASSEDAGRQGLALVFYRAAARVDPAFPSARYNLGRLLLKQGQLEPGMAEVQEALRLYPDFAAAHEVLGLAYTEQGQFARAVDAMQQALALQPDLSSARNHLGRLYRAQGRLEEAIQTFHDLVTRHPEVAEAHHNLAVAYAQQGLRERAITQFTEALRLQPDLSAARLDMAALSLEMQRPQAAIETLQPLLDRLTPAVREHAPFDPAEVHYRLGLAYLQMRQYALAWQHARQATALGAPAAELLAALRRVAGETQ